MKTSIINGSEVSRLSVAIQRYVAINLHAGWPKPSVIAPNRVQREFTVVKPKQIRSG